MTREQILKMAETARKNSDTYMNKADKYGDAHGYGDGVHFALNRVVEALDAADAAINKALS